jgi:hypothetical protein
VKTAKTAKKMTRRRRKANNVIFDSTTILDMDQVYKIINKVQMLREPAKFIIPTSESVVLENILKDLTLQFSCNKVVSGCKHCTEYTIIPPIEDPNDRDFTDVEDFPDEIAEDGIIFFDD